MQKSWKRTAIKTATGRFGGFSSERVSEPWLFVRKWLLLMAVLVAVLALKHLNGRQLEIALFPVKDLLTPARCARGLEALE